MQKRRGKINLSVTTLSNPGISSDRCGSMESGLWRSTNLVSILMAAWLTGKSPVLTMGLSTLTTISVGNTTAMVAAQASAALTTSFSWSLWACSTWKRHRVCTGGGQLVTLRITSSVKPWNPVCRASCFIISVSTPKTRARVLEQNGCKKELCPVFGRKGWESKL